MPKFESGFKVVGRLPDFTLEDVKKEPMLFAYNGLSAYATSEDGGITEAFIDIAIEALDCQRSQLIVDTRTHMLKPGWYPSIPGWHFDECPRATAFLCPSCGHEDVHGSSGDFCRKCGSGPHRLLNQPNLNVDPEGQPEHILALVDIGTGSLTEFIADEVDTYWFDKMDNYESVWGWCDRNINNDRRELGFHRRWVESGQVIKFGHGDFHRAVPATGDGWRMFLRATRYSKRPVFNEIRTQTQVYLSDPTKGW